MRGRPNSLCAISPVVAVGGGEGRVCNSIFSLLTPPGGLASGPYTLLGQQPTSNGPTPRSQADASEAAV